MRVERQHGVAPVPRGAEGIHEPGAAGQQESDQVWHSLQRATVVGRFHTVEAPGSRPSQVAGPARRLVGVQPGPDEPSIHRPGAVTIHGGPPSVALAAALPLAAIALIWRGASTSGLSATDDDLVSPWLIAVLTLAVGGVLGWRALTQRAVLSESGVRCRNLTTSFTVAWDRVERIDVVHRFGLVVYEVHLSGVRRRHRIGAATRFAGDEADVVRDLVAAHPAASSKLELDPT